MIGNSAIRCKKLSTKHISARLSYSLLEYGFAASHLLDGGHILQQYPHWQAIDHDGAKTRHGSLTWMNAFHPEVQQFMLDIITEIVSLYDVDGIQGCDRLPASPVTTGYES